MKSYPAVLLLPDGPANMVIGSVEKHGKAQYERDGAPLDHDVEIPDDLAADGWHWHGSFLAWSLDGLRGVSVGTLTWPPPACFDQARELMRLRLADQPVPKVQPTKRQPVKPVVKQPIVIIAPAQLELELV